MKKALLLLLAAMLLPMAMNAQLLGNSELKFKHAPYALKSISPRMTMAMAPARADLANNQMIMGHYDTDDLASSDQGLGITSLPGVIPIGTIITPDELALFQGGKIVKFRVGLAQGTTVSRVFVIPVTGSSIDTTTEWSCSVNSAGWNEVTLSTPYDINLDSNTGLMIGFDYRQTSSNFPISAVAVGNIYPSYILYQGSWQNVGLDSYGNLSVQCVVESDLFPDYLITIGGLSLKSYIKQGDDFEYNFYTRNTGIATEDVAAGACTYSVLIDGEPVATITNPEAFGGNYVPISSTLSSADLTPGKHTLTVLVSELNGEPVEQHFELNKEFTVYVNGFSRQMHVIEQFTSTYCTWCPLGNSMLSILTNMRDDIAWVGIHQNMNGTDPMRTAQGDSINSYQGCTGYPEASFDRSTGWDADDAICNGLGYDAQYHQMLAEELSNFFDYIAEAPSFATVNISSTIDVSTRNAVITVSGELTPDFDTMLGADSKLTVYITEDGITARQLNQGTWVSNYVHNGVLRRALSSVKGNNLKRNGNNYENVFTYTIPSSWNIDNLNVVAFISRPLDNGGDYTDMFINQANKRKLGEFDEPSLRGDVDGNGDVDIDDVTSLIDFLLNGSEIMNGDCNSDSLITIDDVTALIDFLLTEVWEY